jgi:hypothetical protein
MLNIFFRNVAFQIFGDNSNKTKLKRIMSFEYDAALSNETCCHIGAMSLHLQAKRLFYAKDTTGKFV